jgi:hypothetical protein
MLKIQPHSGSMREATLEVSKSHVKRQAHALVQDADDGNDVIPYAIDNHMRANRIDAVRLGQVGVTVPYVRVQANGLKRHVNHVAVNKDLARPQFLPV